MPEPIDLRSRLSARLRRRGLAASGIAAFLILALTAVVWAAPTVPDWIKQPGTQPDDFPNVGGDPSSFISPTFCSQGACHFQTSLITPTWRGSMMAQAGRDPLFWAGLAIAEQDLLPGPYADQRGGVGDLCLRCHAGNGWLAGKSAPTDGSGLTSPAHAEGVECHQCHLMVDPDEPVNIPNDTTELHSYATWDPDETFRGSGEYVLDGGSVDGTSFPLATVRLGPYSINDKQHALATVHSTVQSSFFRSGDLCGTCHDVSNPVVGDVAWNNGALISTCYNGTNPGSPCKSDAICGNGGTCSGLDPSKRSGALGSQVESKAAFKNAPHKYGVIERTYSEWKSSAFENVRLKGPCSGVDPADCYDQLPADLKVSGGAIDRAFVAASNPNNNRQPDYQQGSPITRTFTCQTCHMPPGTSLRQACGNGDYRADMPVHDLTGGGYWAPDALLWQACWTSTCDARPGCTPTLRFGSIDTQCPDIRDARERAGTTLKSAALIAATQVGSNLQVTVTNLTGHKLITGYSEGRRMWINIKWLRSDDSEISAAEIGRYEKIGDANDLAGTSHCVKSLHDPTDRDSVFEARPGIDQRWAQQLLTLGHDPNLPLTFDRNVMTGPDAVQHTLGELACSSQDAAIPTFHFALNNVMTDDNRIPPYGFSYDDAKTRNALPVPESRYCPEGGPCPPTTYDYWYQHNFPIPNGAVKADVRLYYEQASWEYIQFLSLANDRANTSDDLPGFLASEGENMRDAWLNTQASSPFEMTKTPQPVQACGAADDCHVGQPAVDGSCTQVPKADGEACDDGNSCTENDACLAGSCVGTDVICVAANECQTAGTCVPGQGCVNPPTAEGLQCDDGSSCTTGETCQLGQCVAPLDLTPGDVLPVGANPVSLVAGDWNGDGRLDLAVGSKNPAVVTIKLRNAAGGYDEQTVALGFDPTFLAVGNWDGDDRPDIAVAGGDPQGEATILRNTPSGFVAGPPMVLANVPTSLTPGDWNGDHLLDFATTHSDGRLSIFLQGANGSFSEPAGSPIPVGTDLVSVAAGDWNGDGTPDLAIAHGSTHAMSILRGQCAGRFSRAGVPLVALGSEPSFVAAGDLDGDGKLDLVVSSTSSDQISILLGDGAGAFKEAPGSPISLPDSPGPVALGDLNGDGRVDLVVAHTEFVSTLLGDGAGGFRPSPGSPIPRGARALVIGDFNRDARADIAILDEGADTITILRNTTVLACNAGGTCPQEQDADGDGWLICQGDCDDRNGAINPAAVEVCNFLDDNCDGAVDEGIPVSTYFRDVDRDGYGTASTTTQACAPPPGFVAAGTDCNDADPAIHPGAQETCNHIDDNCDGTVDEGVQTTFYRDADGDGYGTPSATRQDCTAPPGYVGTAGDCNDANSAIHPGAPDAFCNGVDDNCDGVPDDQYVSPTYQWRDISRGVTPGSVISPRNGMTLVDTGTAAIMWGGVAQQGSPTLTNTGAVFRLDGDPNPSTWIATSTGINAPTPRTNHTAVWIGNEMIVWGGSGGGYLATGGRYRPSTDTWTPTSVGANLPTGRELHTVVRANSKMIIWGGGNGSFLNSGAIYDPATDTWTAMSTIGAPSPRTGHTAVWTGTEMIVWGGTGAAGPVNTGGRYNPTTNTWTSMPLGPLVPSAREGHTAVWTGNRMIVWGGHNGTQYFGNGAIFDPVQNQWIAPVGGPEPRTGHTAVWDPQSNLMVVHGGNNAAGTILGSGASFDATHSTWLPLPDWAPRVGHAAVWLSGTGEVMVWGGSDQLGRLNTGARIAPQPPFACGVGACLRLSGYSCSQGQIAYGCTPGAPGVEVCNGIDDDCDGITDGDGDHDGFNVCADCDDTNATRYPGAPELNDGIDNQCPGDPGYGIRDEIAGTVTVGQGGSLCWTDTSGAATYEAARSLSPSFSSCSIVGTADSSSRCITDTSTPPAGETYFYLVRATSPYAGSWGQDSSGVEHVLTCSP